MDILNAFQLFTLLLAVNIIDVAGLTHPLPEDEGILKHDMIKCGTGKEFKWQETEPVGNNMKMTFTCGDGTPQTKTYTCKNGYKAYSKKNEICDPGPDPNFGIYRGGKDPNIMDSARIIYFCMKQSVNTLPPC